MNCFSRFYFQKVLFINLICNVFTSNEPILENIPKKKCNIVLIRRSIYYSDNCPFQEGVFINNCAEDNFAPHRLKFHSASSLIT